MSDPELADHYALAAHLGRRVDEIAEMSALEFIGWRALLKRTSGAA